MDDWQQNVSKRMPPAVAVASAFRCLMDDEFLAGVFERHRGRSYRDVLTFGTLVRLACKALVEHDGSGQQALVRVEECDELEVSQAAEHGKLRRIPQSLSHGLLAETTARPASILQCALCLLLDNLIHLLRDYVAHGQRLPRDNVSQENLFYDVPRELIACDVMFDNSWATSHFRDPLSLAELTKRLATLIRKAWTPCGFKAANLPPTTSRPPNPTLPAGTPPSNA